MQGSGRTGRTAEGNLRPGETLQGDEHVCAGNVPSQDESLDDEDEASVSRALIPSGDEAGSCSPSARSTPSTPEFSSAHQHQTRIIFMDPLVPPSFSESQPDFPRTTNSKQDSSIPATDSTSFSDASQVPPSDPREAPFATVSPSVTMRSPLVPRATKFIHSPLASIGRVRSDEAAFKAATEAREAEVAARVTASLARFLPHVPLNRDYTPGPTGASASASALQMKDLLTPALPNASSQAPSTVAPEPDATPILNAVSSAPPTPPTSTQSSGRTTDPTTNPTPVPAPDAPMPVEQVKRRKRAPNSDPAGQSASTTQTESKSIKDQKKPSASPRQHTPIKATPPPQFPDPTSLPPGYPAYYVPAPYGTSPYYGQPPPPGMYATQLMPYPYPPHMSEASSFVSAPPNCYGELMAPPAYLPPPSGGYGAVQAGLAGYMYAPGGGWQQYGHTMHQTALYNGYQPSGMVEDVHGSESTKVVEDGKVRYNSLPALLPGSVVSFLEWADQDEEIGKEEKERRSCGGHSRICQ